MLITLLHEMQKRDAKKGLATLCIGGGMGIALSVAARLNGERLNRQETFNQLRKKRMARVAIVTGGTRGIGEAIRSR